jgi:phage host-nuclease inhibitor protein Gam
MTRLKKKVFLKVSMDQAQEASTKYSEISTLLMQIEGQLNERINLIKNEYQEMITELIEKRKQHFETLESFAKEQKDNWGKRKSFELLHSVIGFRTGTPKVTKDRKFSWEHVLELVKEKCPAFVRVKCELDKEAIIAMRDEEQFLDLQKSCFVDVIQDEVFFVDPKLIELT